MNRATVVFVVRVWQEYLARDAPSLRGEIVNVTRHQMRPFSCIQELEQLVQMWCLADQDIDQDTFDQLQD